MTPSEWFTLIGAVSTTAAAFLAALALWKIADERRRTFQLGLLMNLLKALGEPQIELAQNACVKLLLRILPGNLCPTLRTYTGQGTTPETDAHFRRAVTGVDLFSLSTRVIDVTKVEIALAVEQAL